MVCFAKGTDLLQNVQGSFDNDEFAEYPFERKDIIKSYNSVAKRIGISGENSGDLLDWEKC